jgi:hypothetical protein
MYTLYLDTQHGYRLPTTRSGVDEENEPISSVFSSPELNTIDDFDAILLSPLSISHRHSPSTSAPISQSKQHKNTIVYNRTGDSAAYYVKQRADLVIKFSKKNVDTSRQNEVSFETKVTIVDIINRQLYHHQHRVQEIDENKYSNHRHRLMVHRL